VRKKIEYIIFLIICLNYNVNIFGQLIDCILDDTFHCYKINEFKVVKLSIKKYYELEDTALTLSSSLLADIDLDCIPELIYLNSTSNKIIIADTRTKKMKKIFDIAIAESILGSSIAMGDVDGDRIPELFILAGSFSANPANFRNRIMCYDLNGNIRWISNVRINNNTGDEYDGMLSLADFNQDGISEIYVKNLIFNALTGILLADGGINGIGIEWDIGYSPGGMSIAAYLDDDPSDLELAAGYSIYKIKINNTNGLLGNSIIAMNIAINGQYRDGLTSIGDINNDGKLDVIVSSPGSTGRGLVYAYCYKTGSLQLIAKAFPQNINTSIGVASIGDIRGIGQPSILVIRSENLHSFSYDGSNILKEDWIINCSDRSGGTGLLLFDLNKDNVVEVIIRDETHIKIIDGSSSTPVILHSLPCFSSTAKEHAIIGDLDNTGQAKICVPCGLNANADIGLINVFGSADIDSPWAPARGIWNQYAYNPLFINDDLTVPQFQKNQATYKNGKYNNFMQQESYVDSNGMVRKAAASLTGKIKCINYDLLTNEYIVVFDLYNRKDASNQADSNLAVSFYNGDPTSSGSLIGIYYTLNSILAGDSLLNLEYRFSASNLKDLFMVVNTIRNGSGVFDDKDFTQAECDYTDNISRTLELPKLDSIQAKICKGASYQFLDTTIQDPGMYYRKLSTINGCDSLIYFLNLSTVDTIYIKQSVATCDVYSWNNKLITQSGTYVFDTLNQFGCDSIISLDLIINKSSINKIQHSACDSYTWNGKTYDKSGFYTFQTMNQAGCDSTIKLELIIHKSDTTNLTIETCDSYVWNGRTYSQSGIYTLDTMNQNGCDSSLTLDLSINSIIQMSTSQSSCDSLTWNGITYTQSGIYKDTTQSSKGCDSITTLQLTIFKSNQSLTLQTSCNSYSWNGTTYTKSGTYTFATQNAARCDSIATLQLTINQPTNSTTNINTCDSLIWNNIIYKQSGTYQYTTLNASGCDSIATLNLSINPSNQIHIQLTACNSYPWNGKTYTQSGSYNYQTINSTGCDSITTLELNIIPSSIKDTSITVCDSITFLNKALNTNGNYTFTLQNTQGCDSVINLNLNINSQHFKSNISTCGSYQWNVNGTSYDSSGIYIAKYTNRSACDSTYQLDLTIHKNYEIKEKAEVCKEYLWPVNKVLYTQSGDYIYPLKTNHGCDSIIKLNLLVNPEFQHTDTVITTDAYTWPINQKTYPTSGTYKEIYQTQNGCDSIHLLLLSINKDVSIYYPNIIHPGGLNSFFTIYVYGASATIKTLSIYDRWGERIWQKQNFPPNELQQGWDGKFKDQDVMPGVYVWHAEIVLKDGSVIMEKGDVTVVR
jgi:hypothetical protein